MALQLLVTVLTIVIVSVVFYLKWSFTFWKKRNVFTLPPRIPFGNGRNLVFATVSLGDEMKAVYKQLKARSLRFGGYYSITQPIFIPVDINLIRNMVSTDFQHFTDHNELMDEKSDPLSGHLFSLTGAKWKALRMKLTPIFTTGKLKSMFQTLVNCSDGMESILQECEKNKESIDIKEIFARYTTDVIASVAFGIECNCLKDPDAEFRRYGKRIFENDFLSMITELVGLFSPTLFKLLGLSLNKRDVEHFFINIVKETAEYRDKNKVERKDFMQLLLNLRHSELKVESKLSDGSESNEQFSFYQNGLSLSEVAAQAFAFFAAGYETSSTALNFLMYELTVNPDIQENLREEIVEVLEKHNNQITYEAISEMIYLDKCISEALRKYPPLPVMLRVCTKTYKIPDSDSVVPKGIAVMTSAYGIHHDPEFYPDPEKFDPERFSEENKKKRPPMTYLAFGEGPRICIGLKLGVLQTKVGLVNMLRKFRFSLNSKTRTPITYDTKQFLLAAVGGIWVDVHNI